MRDGGAVSLTWEAQNGQVAMAWIESGAADLDGANKKAGFGTKLLHMAAAQLGGQIAFETAADVLSVRITFPHT